MSTPFKMKGFSGFANSPIKQDKKKQLKENKKVATKSTRTNEQEDLERQTRIQTNFQNTAARAKRRKKNSLYELGYFQDDDGKMVYPFGKREKMDKAKWNEWKSDPDNKPYKGKTKGLL